MAAFGRSRSEHLQRSDPPGMISIIDIAPNVLAYRVEGKVEKADIDRVFGEVDR